MLNSRLLVFTALAASSVFAQKKEDFQALQRDVALVSADVASMRKSLDDKLTAMIAQMQQSIDANAKSTAAALDRMEQRVNERLADQQKSTNAPIAEMGSKVNGLTDEFQFVRESVAAIDSKMSKMNAQLVDLGNAIRVLQAPPPPPETSVPTAAAPIGPPAGLSADKLYTDARNDMSAGKNDIALQEFRDYLKWFDKTDYAPNAQFYVGTIFYNQANYAEAIKAFDAVLEKYPDNNNKAADAMYMKGRSLAQLGDKPAAAEEFRAFKKKYPRHELTPKVEAELKSAAAAPVQKKKSR